MFNVSQIKFFVFFYLKIKCGISYYSFDIQNKKKKNIFKLLIEVLNILSWIDGKIYNSMFCCIGSWHIFYQIHFVVKICRHILIQFSYYIFKSTNWKLSIVFPIRALIFKTKRRKIYLNLWLKFWIFWVELMVKSIRLRRSSVLPTIYSSL